MVPFRILFNAIKPRRDKNAPLKLFERKNEEEWGTVIILAINSFDALVS